VLVLVVGALVGRAVVGAADVGFGVSIGEVHHDTPCTESSHTQPTLVQSPGKWQSTHGSAVVGLNEHSGVGSDVGLGVLEVDVVGNAVIVVGLCVVVLVGSDVVGIADGADVDGFIDGTADGPLVVVDVSPSHHTSNELSSHCVSEKYVEQWSKSVHGTSLLVQPWRQP